MRRLVGLTMCSVALLVSACSQGMGGWGTSVAPSATPAEQPTPIAQAPAIPLCDTVPRISAPAERYRDSPIYVANEMPVGRIRAWAAGKLGIMVKTRASVDESYADLLAAGHHGRQPPYDAFWGSRYAVVEDPDGNPVGLMSPSDDSKRTPPPTKPPTSE